MILFSPVEPPHGASALKDDHKPVKLEPLRQSERHQYTSACAHNMTSWHRTGSEPLSLTWLLRAEHLKKPQMNQSVQMVVENFQSESWKNEMKDSFSLEFKCEPTYLTSIPQKLPLFTYPLPQKGSKVQTEWAWMQLPSAPMAPSVAPTVQQLPDLLQTLLHSELDNVKRKVEEPG